MNLLTNALKFTTAGKIQVFLRLNSEALHLHNGKMAEPKTHILFVVSDTGVGVPVAKQALLFKEPEKSNPKSKTNPNPTLIRNLRHRVLTALALVYIC